MSSKLVTLAVVAFLLVLGGAAAMLWLGGGPSVADFAHLREPRLTRLDNTRVLVVELKGDPNVVGARAFGALFSAYFKIDGISRLAHPPAPRARWSDPATTPKDQWVGQYALPVPDAAVSVPPASPEAPRPAITTWTYGEVAEILHVGSYASEQPTIERLLNFVASQGYQVVGDHEEEYVKGPGMWFAGDPSDYLTIIRLRVTRAPSPALAPER